MSKNTKRQRTMEDMIGSSSTKKKKENNDHKPTVEKKNLVDNSSKHIDGKGDGIYIISLQKRLALL
jgi:hypothetical protein